MKKTHHAWPTLAGIRPVIDLQPYRDGVDVVSQARSELAALHAARQERERQRQVAALEAAASALVPVWRVR